MTSKQRRFERTEVSASEAARRLSVDKATVIRWIRAGKLRAWKTPGGHWRIPTTEVTRLRRGTMTTAGDTHEAPPLFAD